MSDLTAAKYTEMEQSHSLLLNEQAFRQCPDPHKNMFLYEWLRYLDRVLPLTKKADLKDCQQKLLEQLCTRISTGCAQPSRILLGRCIATLFNIADASHLFQTINSCNDVLKDPNAQGIVKLTALSVLGEMYEILGRMVGRSYEETFQILSKWMKSAESGHRVEILNTLAKMIQGVGSGTFPIYKDLYKIIAKSLTDRVMLVRSAAARCFAYLVAIPDSPLFSQHDLESICTLCIKAFHSSNFEVRQGIALIFAKLAVNANSTHHRQIHDGNNSAQKQSQSSSKSVSMEELLQCLANGMLKGGVGGFLKTAKTATGIQPGGQRETRIGIAEAYVSIASELGCPWLKRNIQFWCRHLLELATKCGSLTSTAAGDNSESSLAIRRCLHFIFRSTIGTQLSELDQISVCKQLGSALAESINSFDCAMDSSKEEDRVLGTEAHASALASTVCLMEIGCIALQVDAAISSIFVEASGILEPIFSSLLHPIQSVRASAAWCIKCIIAAVPSLATPLVDRCLNRLEYLKKSPEAISGFSLALALILAQSGRSSLGIPFSKSRQVFTVAEDMIKSSTQTPRLMQRKVQAGWLLISAICSLGPTFVRPSLSRLFTLWRISFPRSAEETKTERGCGDANSWEATLESRAGALGSMATLIEFCPDLISDELAKRLIVPIETSLSTMAMVGDLLLMHGLRIRPAIQLLHFRLFSLLCRLPVSRYECAVNSLLKELVAEITLSDNSQSAQRNSLCANCCSAVENMFLGGWVQNMEQAYLEVELNPLQTSLPGSFDSDLLHLVEYRDDYREGNLHKCWWPEPQPLPIAAIDSAIQLFGRVFPIVSVRCKLQLLQHFSEQLKLNKPGPRLQALQLNILTAICLASKTIGERRGGRMDDEQLQQTSANLVLPFLSSESVLLKCLAVETLGRLAQAIGTPQFVASNAQYCFDNIRTLKDESSRQGFALALGILHRYMGSLGSGQHLNTSIGILLALAQDTNCSSIRPWAIFSLSQIAITGGGMFFPYSEPVRNLCIQLLLNTQQPQVEVVRAVAKLVFALISAIGPELSTTIGTIEPTRNAFLVACSMLIQFEDSLVKADAIACYQHFHLFAPRFVELNQLVLTVCDLLNSPNVVLRKSAIACLRQLLQQETDEVREHIKPLVPSGLVEEREIERNLGRGRVCLPETGLEGILFEMLDSELDTELREHIKQCLLFLLQSNSDELLGFWLFLCKDILASSQPGQENLRSTMCVNLDESKGENDQEMNTNDDDILQLDGTEKRFREKLSPRWPCRVFAFDVVQRLLALCDTERAHLDLALAKELQMSSEDGRADYLVLHLSDLVRMGFMGATSENTNLRMAGLNCLQNVITKFAKVAEPEFPGHVLLEQFQAQIGAALRPAFSPETPGNVTALACLVASSWICSGVARDLNDLRRVHQLLASSLAKLTQQQCQTTQIYNENVSTLERLAILRAWAKVYICAIEQRRTAKAEMEPGNCLLLGLVEPELDTLVDYWFAALRDFALLSLPSQFGEQVAEIGGTFFTPDSMEICKDHYRASWPLILLACSVWVNQRETEYSSNSATTTTRPHNRAKGDDARLYLMLGICLDSLCSNRQYSADQRPAHICLSSLKNLLTCQWIQLELMSDIRLPIELLNVLYKLILTRDNMQTQKLCLDLVAAVLAAAERKIAVEAAKLYLDQQNGNEEYSSADEREEDDEFQNRNPFSGGEGRDGIFDPANSLVFALLEPLMCLLVRQIPQINLAQAKVRVMTPLHVRKCAKMSAESDDLIHSTLELLGQLLPLCCTEGQLVVMPSLLKLLFGVLRECSRPKPESADRAQIQPKAVNSAIMKIRKISSCCPHPDKEPKLFAAWESIMRSALLTLLNLSRDSHRSCPEQSSAALFSAVVLFLSASTSMPSTSSAPGSPSQHPTTSARLCIGEDLFSQLCQSLRQALHSNSLHCQLKAVQNVRLLFQCRPICGPFVRELGNDIFSTIRPFVINGDAEETEGSSTTREPQNVQEAQLIKETAQTIEAVLATAKGERERLFVSLLVRSLTEFLRSNLSNISPFLVDLHEFALTRLNAIGTQHAESFKILLQAAPEIRQKIESATQARISSRKGNQESTRKQSNEAMAIRNMAAQQSIKLSTDFRAFTAKDEQQQQQASSE